VNVQAAALIRRPPADVFNAFVDPDITTKFWFTKSTGRLEENATVTWTWEMYEASTEVNVKAIEPNKRILVDWNDATSEVEWRFDELADGTYVTVTNSGLETVEQALDSKGGFTFLVASAKFYLEHGIEPNIVADAHR
jgi:uncharacterized protein YndB with AHSA1/START domain